MCFCFDEKKAVEVREKLAILAEKQQTAAYENDLEKYDTSLTFEE